MPNSSCKLTKTKYFVLVIAYGSFSALGATAGGHRLWSHRAYKADYKLRILLCIAHTAVGQKPLYEWVIDYSNFLQ